MVNVLKIKDYQLKKWIKMYPNTNPLFFRYGKAQDLEKTLEMYKFQYITRYGQFIYHFDVEMVNNLVREQKLPLEKIQLDDLALDLSTKLIKSKLDDKRFPIFLRFYGLDKPYICLDGNKRIQARATLNNENVFKGFVIYPTEVINSIFFTEVELLFFVFNFECVNLIYGLQDGWTEKELWEFTQAYLKDS
ncbi:hypothetical protein E2L07_20475 [Halalkalibacterium halodurans]|uniref:hypothetical protein n=1 Tax=Halalkalibacterium halodurans TaxID=86665 RepID=UPI0010684F4B|nr:hypothetical protein [Halalkalibacterium halodurans]TES45503.1 hypothetical protein E2L07_20475 [Halalkalibacterium halodurans]